MRMPQPLSRFRIEAARTLVYQELPRRISWRRQRPPWGG
jgi:hypothetical protein